MWTRLITVPRALRSSVRRMLAESAEVTSFDNVPIVANGVSWTRFACLKDRSVAIVAVGDTCPLGDFFWVAVSPDLRRMWRVWSIAGDIRLARLIARRLVASGATVSALD